MTKKVKRLDSEQVQEDKNAYKGFKHIKNYKPNNEKFSRAKGTNEEEELTASEEEFRLANEHYTKALTRIAKAEKRMHEFVQGMKDQVVSQFGDDSDEITMVGLKKKSDYKKPERKSKKAGDNNNTNNGK